MRLAGHLAHTVEKSNTLSVMVEKPEGKKPLGKLKNS
jgi:hypothetical protein